MPEADETCGGEGTDQYICPSCGTRSPSVTVVTLYHLLKPFVAREIKPDQTYGVCQTRSCPVMYFSSDHAQFWKVSDIRTTVGFKQAEDEPPHPVCYCFGYTEEKIAGEIDENGESTVVDWITERVQADECACEYKNPTGQCCLGNVRRIVNRIQNQTV
jgi:hypothetical protein